MRVMVVALVIFIYGIFFSIANGKTEKRYILNSDVATAASIQTLTRRVEELSTEMAHLKFTGGGGSVYTRWGRTICPQNGSELVYTGYTGGNSYNSWGAADFICLSSDPLWGQYDDAAQPNAQQVHGAEYQFADQFYDGGTRFFGKNLQNHDVPCAVCRSSRPTTVMIPGRNQCYPGWTMEYWGYLVSSYSGHPSPSNYACLDTNAEWEVGDVDDKNGKLMYLTEATCGSLRCPPYVQNREITCVVCTK